MLPLAVAGKEADAVESKVEIQSQDDFPTDNPFGGVLPPCYKPAAVEQARERLREMFEEVARGVCEENGGGDGSGAKLALTKEVEYFLLCAMDNFITTTTRTAAVLAAHRGSSEIRAQDVKLSMKMEHGVGSPTTGGDLLASSTAVKKTGTKRKATTAIGRKNTAATKK